MNTQRVEGHTPDAWLIDSADAYFATVDSHTAQRHEIERAIVTPLYKFPDIERLEKVNEALVRALEEVSQVLTVEEHQNPGKGWGDFLEKDVLPALKLAKEPA